MEASRSHLRLYVTDPDTGEAHEIQECPDCRERDAQIRMMDRDLKGKRLRIATLEADREAELMRAPERRAVEVVHICWKAGTGRRRDLHPTDREQIGRAVKNRDYGLRGCLIAVAGAVYDPNLSPPQRNGRRERFNDLDLIFRNYAKLDSFIARAPTGYQPNPHRIAELCHEPLEWVRDQLGEAA